MNEAEAITRLSNLVSESDLSDEQYSLLTGALNVVSRAVTAKIGLENASTILLDSWLDDDHVTNQRLVDFHADVRRVEHEFEKNK